MGPTQDKLKFVGLFFLVLPFTQIGFTYYISFQLLLVLILLMNTVSGRELKLTFLFLLVLVPVMVFPAMIASQGKLLHTIMLTSRECLILSFLLSVAVVSRSYSGINKEYFKYILCFFLVVVSVQLFFLKTSGIILAFPSEFLVTNKGTLAGLEFALSLGIIESLRAPAFYGEPSYLAFVSTSLFYIILVNDVFSYDEKKRYAVLVFLIVLISQSMAGLLAVSMLLGAFFLKNINVKYLFYLLVCVFLLVIALIWFRDLAIIQRLLSILSFDGSDASSVTRFVAPMTLISSVFQDYPFGGTSRDLLERLYAVEGTVRGVDNALLNIFINYGYLGFVIWGIVIAVFFRTPLTLVYIIIVSNFNGSLFSIDKLGVIGMALILARSSQKKRETIGTSNIASPLYTRLNPSEERGRR